MGVWFQCQFHFWQYSVLLAKSAEDRDIGGHEGSTIKLNSFLFLIHISFFSCPVFIIMKYRYVMQNIYIFRDTYVCNKAQTLEALRGQKM